MIFVGYGIAAFIVIVLLIVFNVRAASRRSAAAREETVKEPSAASVETEKPVAAQSAAADTGRVAGAVKGVEAAKAGGEAERTEAAPEVRHRTVPPRDAMKDQVYRNALRDLKAGAGAPPPQAARPPVRKEESLNMPDSDYRNAMRNFRKSSSDEGPSGNPPSR